MRIGRCGFSHRQMLCFLFPFPFFFLSPFPSFAFSLLFLWYICLIFRPHVSFFPAVLPCRQISKREMKCARKKERTKESACEGERTRTCACAHKGEREEVLFVGTIFARDIICWDHNWERHSLCWIVHARAHTRERERRSYLLGPHSKETLSFLNCEFMSIFWYVFVCVCVWEREIVGTTFEGDTLSV